MIFYLPPLHEKETVLFIYYFNFDISSFRKHFFQSFKENVRHCSFNWTNPRRSTSHWLLRPSRFSLRSSRTSGVECHCSETWIALFWLFDRLCLCAHSVDKRGPRIFLAPGFGHSGASCGPKFSRGMVHVLAGTARIQADQEVHCSA